MSIPWTALLSVDRGCDSNPIAMTLHDGVGHCRGHLPHQSFNCNGDLHRQQLRWRRLVYTGSTSSPVASDTGVVTVDRIASATLTGTDFGEILIGRSNGSTINANGGNDVLIGGAGNDTLNGGAGADMMTGAGGSDTFVFKAITDSQPGAGRSGHDHRFHVRHRPSRLYGHSRS